jgi:type IV secretion system protein VirB8
MGIAINKKQFDPFVIKIDNDTGITQIVDPVDQSILSGNDALARYFIKEYITARETYNPVDFKTRARNIVRLFSTPSVYRTFLNLLDDKSTNPLIQYGQDNTTYLVLKSWSKLDDSKFLVRFSINQTSGQRKIFNKIAVVEYKYVTMQLSEKDMDINPVGFQISGYRVDNDDSK